MAIVSVGAISSLLALGCYMLFLSGLGVISLIFGYITAGLQILSGLSTYICCRRLFCKYQKYYFRKLM